MKITDSKVKKFIAFLMRNKEELLNFIDYFDPEDIENGLLRLPEELVNTAIKSKVMKNEQIREYLKDYRILLQNGFIMLDLKLHLKQLGPVAAKYMVSIKDLRFTQDNQRIYATFNEDAVSLGNMPQSMALKAAMANSTLLQKAVHMTNCNFISIDGHNLMVDLGKFEVVQRISDSLEVNYMDCQDGELKLNFYYCS